MKAFTACCPRHTETALLSEERSEHAMTMRDWITATGIWMGSMLVLGELLIRLLG